MRLAHRTGGSCLWRISACGQHTRVTTRGAVRQLTAVDRAVYDAIAATPTRALDGPLRQLSRAAGKSRIWLTLAAVLALAGGAAGRRSAVRGPRHAGYRGHLSAGECGHQTARPRGRRRRAPDKAGPDARLHLVPLRPFRVGVRACHLDQPGPALVRAGRGFLAAAVAYSRVHTGSDCGWR